MAASAGTDILVRVGYWIFQDDSTRPDLNRPVSEIPSQLFTDLYAGFAVVDIDTGGVTFPTQYQVQFKQFPNTVRQQNPTVRTLLSIGGPGYGISQVARDETRRQKFIKESICLARTFGYNGLDLCLQYPSPFDNGDDLIALLREWRDALRKEASINNHEFELLLTAAVFHHSAIPSPNGRSFNYPDISAFLDWINVLGIDFYIPSNSSGDTGPVHAWNTRFLTDRHHEPNYRGGSDGVGIWINNNNGVAAQKLVLALPFEGCEWNLINRNVCQYVAPAAPPANYKKKNSSSDMQQKIVNANYHKTSHKSSNYFVSSSHTKKTGHKDETRISERFSQAKIIVDGDGPRGTYVAWQSYGDNCALTHAAYGGNQDGRFG